MNAPAEAALRRASLDDRYQATEGAVYLTGTQALVRLPILQRQRDAAAGLNTAGYISGYRGSPLGGYDQALEKARAHLDAHHVRFVPGLNEDLGATTACSRSGTARDRASIAAATCSATRTRRAPRATAACSPWPATTTVRNRRPSPRRPTSSSRRCRFPCSRQPPCRTTSTSACTAWRCRASPACGSR